MPEGFRPGEPSIYFKQDEPPAQPELRKKEVRTKESEVRANVEFWKELGIDIDEEDVRKKIETLPELENFNYYLFIPKGIKISEVWKAMKDVFLSLIEKNRVIGNNTFGDIGDIDHIQSPRSNEDDSYAVASQYSQGPDEGSLGVKSALEWEKTGEQFMSPLERISIGLRWFIENDTQLDEQNKTATLCPGSRTETGQVPAIDYDTQYGPVVSFFGVDPDKSFAPIGVRRIISQSTSEEIIAKYKEMENQ